LELCCCGLFYVPCGFFEPVFRFLPQDFLLTLRNFFLLVIGRFLDPTLSVFSFPMPGIEYRLVGATRCWISLPAAHAGDWFRPAGQSVRYCCSTLAVTGSSRPLLELGFRSEYRTRRSIATTGSAIPFCRQHSPRLYGVPSAGCGR